MKKVPYQCLIDVYQPKQKQPTGTIRLILNLICLQIGLIPIPIFVFVTLEIKERKQIRTLSVEEVMPMQVFVATGPGNYGPGSHL